MKCKNLLIPAILLFFAGKSFAAGSASDSNRINYAVFNSFSNGDYNTRPGVWPNPAKDFVNINSNSIKPGDVGQCVVYNSAGLPVVMQNISNGTNQINTSNLQSGMYFVRITTKNKEASTEKIIVKR